jgi:hypothetical protein
MVFLTRCPSRHLSSSRLSEFWDADAQFTWIFPPFPSQPALLNSRSACIHPPRRKANLSAEGRPPRIQHLRLQMFNGGLGGIPQLVTWQDLIVHRMCKLMWDRPPSGRLLREARSKISTIRYLPEQFIGFAGHIRIESRFPAHCVDWIDRGCPRCGPIARTKRCLGWCARQGDLNRGWFRAAEQHAFPGNP